MTKLKHHQSGASLIEVLVAILLLSFGMLSLGGMLAYAVQLPKLSAYRATAAMLASQHIERMRANPGAATPSTGGYSNGDYTLALTYDGTSTIPAASACTYPACTESTLATMDNAFTQRELRKQLPAGGMIVKSTVAGALTYGELWIVWLEPDTFAAMNRGTTNNTDNCPSEVTTVYNTAPIPRCLYVRFKI